MFKSDLLTESNVILALSITLTHQKKCQITGILLEQKEITKCIALTGIDMQHTHFTVYHNRFVDMVFSKSQKHM